jgi:hypothetical protein
MDDRWRHVLLHTNITGSANTALGIIATITGIGAILSLDFRAGVIALGCCILMTLNVIASRLAELLIRQWPPPE